MQLVPGTYLVDQAGKIFGLVLQLATAIFEFGSDLECHGIH